MMSVINKGVEMCSILFAGEFQIGDSIKPYDPSSVASVVLYGKVKSKLNHSAVGESLIYSQLYPFVGLQNYTSGIIHHVELTGIWLSLLRFC